MASTAKRLADLNGKTTINPEPVGDAAQGAIAAGRAALADQMGEAPACLVMTPLQRGVSQGRGYQRFLSAPNLFSAPGRQAGGCQRHWQARRPLARAVPAVTGHLFRSVGRQPGAPQRFAADAWPGANRAASAAPVETGDGKVGDPRRRHLAALAVSTAGALHHGQSRPSIHGRPDCRPGELRRRQLPHGGTL